MVTGPCCASGLLKRGYQAKGAMKTIGGVQCYVATPTGTKQAKFVGEEVYVFDSDVFGVYENSKWYADRLAEEGSFSVVVPDYFHGHGAPGSTMETMFPLMQDINKGLFRWRGGLVYTIFGVLRAIFTFIRVFPSMILFLARNGKPTSHIPDAEHVHDALIKDFGVKKIVHGGYCYGAEIALHFADPKYGDVVKGLVVAHGKVPMEEVEKMTQPGLFICCPKDRALTDEMRAELEKKIETHPNKAVAKDSVVKLFAGSHHGFTLRGDPALAPQVEEAFYDTLKFSERRFGWESSRK